MQTANHEIHQGKRGFTLIEVLVALAVLAIALVAIFQLFSANLRGLSASHDYAAAAVKAEAKMREILDDERLVEKSWSETTEDGYRIDAAVAGIEEERTETLPVRLLEINLSVRWTDSTKERTLKLKAMKLVNRQI